MALTVELTTGTISGAASDGIVRHLGIPYAEPPFGSRRFAAPEPVAPWTGVRETTAFSATAPQAPYSGPIGELLGSVRIDGEDILTANVWAPESATNAPVVVWIHGGALERGTPALDGYDGSTWARDGIVFVSLGHRLGSEGFSVLDGAPMNLGLRDVALGLEWVHREIVAFGGDPSRITLMGESAGGFLVAGLLARPASRALVAGAIIQSGPLDAKEPKAAGKATAAIAKHLGIPATRDAFAAVSPAELIAARAALAAGSSPLSGTAGFALAIDGDSLPQSPIDALPDVDIPVLIGTNTDEYRLWFPPEALAKISPLQLFLGRLALRIPRRAASAVREAVPGATTGEVFGHLATEVLLRSSMVRAAGARPAPTYVYEFAWRSPVRDLRACHALELGFTFDALDSSDARRLGGTQTPQQLADEMHAAWVRMIRDGDPGWSAYRPERTVRVFDEPSRTSVLPRAAVADAMSRSR